MLRSAVLLTTAAYLVVAFAGVDTAGGKALGPRLLLPLFPLLTVSAHRRDRRLSRQCRRRPTAGSGVPALVLAGMAVTIHLLGHDPGLHYRNRDDSRMIRSVVDSRERLDRGRRRVHRADAAAAVLPARSCCSPTPRSSGRKLGARLAAERQTQPRFVVTRARRRAPSDLCAVPEPRAASSGDA